MTVVFDFDRTLTERDTVFRFYKEFSKNIVKLTILTVSMIFSKIGILTNATIKKIGVHFFLLGLPEKVVIEKGQKYFSKIRLREDIIARLEKHVANGDKVVVLSASYECYISALRSRWNDVIVIGSKLAIDKDGKVQGLSFNCYGENKLEALQRSGIHSVDILYTDGFADRAIMRISKKVIVVRKHGWHSIKLEAREV
ncbi:MAG: HAD-IB family phosphatase [Bacteroidota bacterium]